MPTLDEQLDPRQPLKQLADTLPWSEFEQAFDFPAANVMVQRLTSANGNSTFCPKQFWINGSVVSTQARLSH
jgi:hypothetical protein